MPSALWFQETVASTLETSGDPAIAACGSRTRSEDHQQTSLLQDVILLKQLFKCLMQFFAIAVYRSRVGFRLGDGLTRVP